MTDKIKDALLNLAGNMPKPRLNLTESQKDELISNVGPKTARSIVLAKKDCPLARIPFLFSSIDTQAVLDILANDVDAAIQRALAGGKVSGK